MPTKIKATAFTLPGRQFLGNVVALTAAREDGSDGLWGEGHLLVERGVDVRVHSRAVSCDLRKMPRGHANEFNIDFMLGEAMASAESILSMLRIEEVKRSNDWSTFNGPIAKRDIDDSLAAWVIELRGWPAEIAEVAQRSQMAALSEQLQLVATSRRAILGDDKSR